jgi:hypothetical protein
LKNRVVVEERERHQKNIGDGCSSRILVRTVESTLSSGFSPEAKKKKKKRKEERHLEELL